MFLVRTPRLGADPGHQTWLHGGRTIQRQGLLRGSRVYTGGCLTRGTPNYGDESAQPNDFAPITWSAVRCLPHQACRWTGFINEMTTISWREVDAGVP